MKKIVIFVIGVLVATHVLYAQQRSVSGLVTSAEDGLPVIGASVLEKGTSNGTITDVDGVYTLVVSEGATLVVSYVGMQSAEIKVTSDRHNIKLKTDAVAIDEVVVTAMGIKQEKKRMNFAVQSVDGDAITDSRSANFVNSLQGKIAGISVTNSSGSPNSESQIIVRGIASINPSQNNEPMFILDGIPLSGGGSAAADINPNDIENITVLKGAAAAALYGQDAANGVIMITTKQGEIGKVSVTANASVEYDMPTRVPQLQTSYMPGSQGFYKEKTMGGWGPLLAEGQTIYDNVNNFLQNGLYQKYDVSMTGGSEKFQAYASAQYSKNDGIVPNDYLDKIGVMLKGTYTPVKSLTVTVSANILETTSRTFAADGMSSVYNWPITDDITNYENVNGYPRFLYYADVNKYDSPVSPLFSRYNDYEKNKALRNILHGSINWKPFKNFEITGRVSYDTKSTSTDSYQVPRWDDTVIYQSCKMPAALSDGATAEEQAQYAAALAAYEEYTAILRDVYPTSPYLTSDDISNMDWDLLGLYKTRGGKSQLFTASAIATYKIELPLDFSIDLLAGTEMKISEGFSMSNAGRDFIIPGVYSLSNTNSEYLKLTDRTAEHSGKRTFGYFGEIRGDYKGLASLSVTGRWDWSSTILKNPYFYPSITAGLLFSELFGIAGDVFSYGKLRGNYAVVGKDAPAYLYDRRFKQFATYPDGGYGIDPTLSSASKELMPEMSYSWEVGADLRFFNNKTRLDVAYYSTKVDNQIVTVRVSPSSGYILQTRNEGAVRNHGVEFTLDQDIINRDAFAWTASLNFGLNRGTVVSLPEDVAEITGKQYGDIYTSAYLGASTTAISGKDYLRTNDGQIICTADGYPQIDTNKNKLIGNREPLFQAGLTNMFRYKGWSLSFMFDGRLGGDVVNVTGRGLISNGQSAILEKYRGRQVVVEGVVLQEDGTYAPNTMPIQLDYQTITNYFYNVSSNFVEDGSYIRLSYVTLAYDFSHLLKKKVLQGLRLSLTGNNLFLLTKYTGSDPTCNASASAGGTGSAGIDNYAVPSTRGINCTVSVSF